MAGITKSIQPITISMTSTLAGSAVISPAVEVANTMLLPNGYSINGLANMWQPAPTITLASSILISSSRPSTVNCIAQYTLVEFQSSAVASIQYGVLSFTSSNSTGSATIAAVSTRAFVIPLGRGHALNTNVTPVVHGAGLNLLSTLVEGTQRATPADARTVDFCVVDLQPSVVEACQRISFTSSANTTVDTTTIAGVDLGRTLFISGGIAANETGGGSTTFLWTPSLASTSITWTRAASTNTRRTHYANLVTFVATVLATTVQRGVLQISSDVTTGSATIAVVNSNAILNSGYFYPSRPQTSDGAISNSGQCAIRLALASTVVTGIVHTTTTGISPRQAWYEVVQFSSGEGGAAFRRNSNLHAIETGERYGLHPIDHGVRPFSIVENSL